ncbi:MAG: hypothetical protein QOK30_1483 [Nocardioidaceae bacterium]|nr:hypothetical protein [Nocardioidaceae bacterium]
MTVLLTMDLPVSREILEAVSSQMGVRDDPPDGLVVHVMTRRPTVSMSSMSGTASTSSLGSETLGCFPRWARSWRRRG